MRVVFDRHAGELQREISFDAGADFARTLDVDIEAAVGQLLRENALGRAVDLRRGRAGSRRRSIGSDASRAAAGCNRIRGWYRR